MPFQLLRDNIIGGPGLSFGAGGAGGAGAALPGSSLDINFAAGTWGTALGPNLVTNGSFDTDIAGWTLAFNGTLSWSAGRLRITSTGGSSGRAMQTLTGLTVGAMYTVTGTLAAVAPVLVPAQMFITANAGGSTSGAVVQGIFSNTLRTETLTFIATAATLYIVVMCGSVTATEWAEWDNVSCRQVNPQALGPEKIVNGTFTTDISGWTPAVTGSATVTWDATGALLLTGTASGQAAASQTLTGLTVGQMYQLKFDNGGPNGVMVTVGSVLNVSSVIAGNANIFTFIAATTSVTLTFTRTGGAAFVAKIDNVSVMEVSPPIERILTTSRASPGMAQRLDGSWADFAANVPRITDRGLLVEEVRTNLALWSNAFGDAAWNVIIGAVTVVDNAILAPDNTMSASRMTGLIADTTRRQGVTAATGVYTFSVWLKLPSGSAPWATNIYIRHTTNDLAAITVTDQWQRFSVTTTTTLTGLTLQIGGASTWGIGREIHAWGGQLELGAFATSPIKTTSAAVTRATESVVMSTGPWHNQAAGTILTDSNGWIDAIAATQCIVSFDDNSANERIQLRRSATAGLSTVVVDNNVVQASQSVAATMPLGGRCKNAQAYALDDFQIGSAGSLGAADNLGTLPTVNRVEFGNGWGTTRLNGYLQRVTYFPTRLPNAELQALTAS